MKKHNTFRKHIPWIERQGVRDKSKNKDLIINVDTEN